MAVLDINRHCLQNATSLQLSLFNLKRFIALHFAGGINSIRRTIKNMNETMSQLVDAVRTVQEDQSRMSIIIDKLATKVIYTITVLV